MSKVKLMIEMDEDIYHFVMNTGTFGHYRFNTAEAIRKGKIVEESDDAVSRQAVIDEVKEIAEWHSGDAFNEDRVITHMKMLPPVLPKRKQNVLDKIRTEIEQEYTRFHNKSDMWSERAWGLGTALEIIDKYRKEQTDV